MTEHQTTEEYKPLQIMNASAGSGKTYNLVMSYLKLILGDKSSPTQFSKIMAMTFTNKAAFEMKSRIIEALDLLGNKIDFEIQNNTISLSSDQPNGIYMLSFSQAGKKYFYKMMKQ